MTNWKNIHWQFNQALQQQWQKQGFTYAQTKEWIDIGLKITDYEYAYWLAKVVELDPLTVLNEGYDPDLREQFAEWKENQSSKKPSWPWIMVGVTLAILTYYLLT